MKRLIKVISIGLIMVILLSMSGCFLFSDGKTTVGDFVVKYRKPETKYPDGYYLLYELSKAGKKKKNIILPKEINGRPYLLRFNGGALIGDAGTNAVFAGKMEKVYIEYPGNYCEKRYKDEPACIWFTGDKYLKKVIVNIQNIRFRKNNLGPQPILFCYNYSLRSFACNQDENNNYIAKERLRLANIQFLYNYEEAPNEGYFWIDDIDNGEKMEVMPDTPEREGYTFEGWYNEKECINKFDFETVFNKPVLNEGDIYPEDYVTYVYAKWTQNP